MTVPKPRIVYRSLTSSWNASVKNLNRMAAAGRKAGTFGLEAEHAAMATAMAERDLLLAVRAAPDARVIADGFSCRAQMRAQGDHRARHLAVLLHDALADPCPS